MGRFGQRLAGAAGDRLPIVPAIACRSVGIGSAGRFPGASQLGMQ